MIVLPVGSSDGFRLDMQRCSAGLLDVIAKTF